VSRLLTIATALFLLFPTLAFAASETGAKEEEFDPSAEWKLHTWIDLPFGMDINKGVAYLLLGSLLTIVLGIVIMRVPIGRGPNRRQAIGEIVYEIAQIQVAEQGLPTKAIGRWFPYCATLMLFVWVVNIIGFIPLPLSDEKWHGLPTLGVFAATSTLSVTLALALMTFVFTHVEGIRENGPVKYFKSWIPQVPKVMYVLIVPLEILGQFMRLISLSVRLYANMLAGHMLILTFIGLIFIIGNIGLAIVAVPAATIMYLFEVVIVVTIQAYIFAALSAIYIGSAIEPDH